ncbi:MAG: dodecin family protein [Candidatus Hodarchaeales archaeon]|jgi:flavin-binding protein dodecin
MESTYKLITLVGSSPNSFEEAIQNAVTDAGKSLRDLRIATVEKQDCKIENGKIVAYRVRFTLSFKYEV